MKKRQPKNKYPSLTDSQYAQIVSCFAEINEKCKTHILTIDCYDWDTDKSKAFKVEGAVDDHGNLWLYDAKGNHLHLQYHGDEEIPNPYQLAVDFLTKIKYIPKPKIV